MHSFDNNLDLDRISVPTLDLTLTLLLPLGLLRDSKQLPAFSLYDLFESLLRGHNISKPSIKRKMTSLHSFLLSDQLNSSSNPFIQSLVHNTDKIAEDLDSSNLFYNNVILNLFSYAFGLRLEIYHYNEGKISVQYFGLKNKKVKRALVTVDSYIVLKQMAKRPDVTGASQQCRGLSPVGRVNKLKSYRTMTTKFTEGGYAHLELNKCISDNTGVNHTNDEFNENGETGWNFQNSEVYRTIDNEYPSINQMNGFTDYNQNSAYNQAQSAQYVKNHPNSDHSTNDSDLPKNQPALVFDAPPTIPIKLSQLSRTEGKSIGRLKFYNEAKEYGFIIMDDESEIFVHKADLIKQNIDTRYLAYYKKYYEIIMEFTVQEYQGKVRMHRKAVDVLICDMQAIC